jgi:glutamyl-tRNA synthetase
MENKTKIDLENKFIPAERKEQVRVRFAPSPTGFFHIGSARTALFNYLFAKKYEGKFILRIEDTDFERSKKEFESDIVENLNWLGIKWDEGPALISPEGETREFPISNFQNKRYVGDYGPYRQSERKDIYKKYLKKLLEENKAYYCFCSKEEIEAKKQEQLSRGLPPHYNGKCANLSDAEVKKRLKNNEPCVIRFKIPQEKISFQDAIRGRVEFDAGLFGDIVIAKNLDAPLFNFAVVVDDFEMKISHIIRGEDHLPNTPKQIILQKALGFCQPIYGHLPLILGPDKSKLSKRHGAMSLSEYRDLGYLPESIINFLAFLGWNPGSEREIYSLSSLIKDFSIEKIQKSGAVFNIKKLDFLNGFYIRQKPLEKLTELCLPYLIDGGLIKPIFKSFQEPPAYGGTKLTQSYKISEIDEEVSFEWLKAVVAVCQERLKKLSEIVDLADFFFKAKLDYQKDLLIWKDAPDSEIKFSLDKSFKILSKIKDIDYNRENLKNILIAEADQMGDRGKLLWPLRVALSGKQASPSPFEIAEILGKEKTLKRIKEAREKFRLE